MEREEALVILAQWCFTARSLAELQFMQGTEYISEIKCVHILNPSANVYLILPKAGHEETVNRLCLQNGLVRINEDSSSSFSFLETFRQRHQMLWDELLESM
ncbi:MAG: hypothetical protein HY007_00400 [Candidatus Sungbacteria bacterium]|nr:hypothetical protein [Candidatus Sungbacteria bacterium]